ncbi:hypothetical protein [Caldithrix abyssi]
MEGTGARRLLRAETANISESGCAKAPGHIPPFCGVWLIFSSFIIIILMIFPLKAQKGRT